MSELQATPLEELDLLQQYLGTESSRYASSIRAANAHNPQRGVDKIWERLNDQYGRPEIVENALKLKLNNFPQLTARDYKRLYL